MLLVSRSQEQCRGPRSPAQVVQQAKARTSPRSTLTSINWHHRNYLRLITADREPQRLSRRLGLPPHLETPMKTCDHCGESFKPYRPTSRYCTSICRSRAYGKRRTADGRRAAYREGTADKIRAANMNARVERTCMICGAIWRTRRPDARYCSRDCYRQDIQAGNVTVGRPKKPVPPKPVRRSGLRELFEQERYDEALHKIMARTELLDSGCRVVKGKEDEPYPQIYWSKNTTRGAHRLVLWAKTGGTIDGWHAHHRCANPVCVEPDHLVPATAAENSAEMLARRTYEAEIEALRAALAELAPAHPLLRRHLTAVA